jgi:hypothetical protein
MDALTICFELPEWVVTQVEGEMSHDLEFSNCSLLLDNLKALASISMQVR